MTFTENRDFPKSPPILQEPLPNIGEEEKTEEIEVVEEEGLDKLVLTIEVFEQSCWVRVYGDGNIVFEKTMQKGEKTVIEAQENIRITLGNAGVTRLYLGNEDLGIPGNVGQVINKTFLIEDYQ